MTKIYTYCLFDYDGNFEGVYSSLKNAYRDALKLSNTGYGDVCMMTTDGWIAPSLKELRNVVKGKFDIVILFKSSSGGAKILKTKLRE